MPEMRKKLRILLSMDLMDLASCLVCCNSKCVIVDLRSGSGCDGGVGCAFSVFTLTLSVQAGGS